MPEYLVPGVEVAETSCQSPTIVPLATAIAAFVGEASDGPDVAASPRLRSLAEFEAIYGSEPDSLWYAVRAYFDEGGRTLHVVRVDGAASTEGYRQALAVLAEIEDIDLVAAPRAFTTEADAHAIASALIAHAEACRHRVAIIDSPPDLDADGVLAWRGKFESGRAALYFPWIRVAAPGGGEIWQAPSAFVAGIYARVDIERGISKAPANEIVRSALAVATELNNAAQARLNPFGVNAIRRFAGRGIRVWGARTLSADPEWKYVNVRRMFSWMEHSIEAGMQWVALEPNDQNLWLRVRQSIEAFMIDRWRDGMLQGDRPDRAFFVKCDATTMTAEDIAAGQLVCIVGVAAVQPAEFVIIRFGWTTLDTPPP